MQVISLIWGILALVGMVIGFVPCLGALNWLNIPFSGIGLIISGIALATAGDKPKASSIVGLILCTIAVFFGLIRLIVGGGIV
jgi:hypothetical protein